MAKKHVAKKAGIKKAGTKKKARKKAVTKKAISASPPFVLSAANAPPAFFFGPSANNPPAEPLANEPLLVCIQHPYEGRNRSRKSASAEVPSYDGKILNKWKLTATFEAFTPTFLEGWATRGNFTLDLRVTALASYRTRPISVTSLRNNCRLIILKDGEQNVRFSIERAAHHVAERKMPAPEKRRFFNADIAFQPNGPSAINVGATAVISELSWPQLTAGSAAPSKGLAFDSKWQKNLKSSDGLVAAGKTKGGRQKPGKPTADGSVSVTGPYAFAVMEYSNYQSYCKANNMSPRIV